MPIKFFMPLPNLLLQVNIAVICIRFFAHAVCHYLYILSIYIYIYIYNLKECYFYTVMIFRDICYCQCFVMDNIITGDQGNELRRKKKHSHHTTNR